MMNNVGGFGGKRNRCQRTKLTSKCDCIKLNVVVLVVVDDWRSRKYKGEKHERPNHMMNAAGAVSCRFITFSSRISSKKFVSVWLQADHHESERRSSFCGK